MVDAFRHWTGQRRMPLRTPALLDNAFEIYFDHIFFAGRNISDARYTLWGWGYVNDVLVTAPAFPKARCALRGLGKASPDR
eukprot:5871068-Heterocapsa_arctica.AAC.1